MALHRPHKEEEEDLNSSAARVKAGGRPRGEGRWRRYRVRHAQRAFTSSDRTNPHIVQQTSLQMLIVTPATTDDQSEVCSSVFGEAARQALQLGGHHDSEKLAWLWVTQHKEVRTRTVCTGLVSHSCSNSLDGSSFVFGGDDCMHNSVTL